MMISRRTQMLKPSPTLALAAKAKVLKSEGKDVISLSVGEPDWDTFSSIKAKAIEAIETGQTKYTPANGIPELRRAIAKQTNEDLGTQYDENLVTVSTGGKFIIYSAFQSIIDPGDEVIIPAPYWVSYPTMVELAEGKPVIVSCGKEVNYKLTPELLEGAITAKTKCLVLNSPSNPTGLMYSESELGALGKVLQKHPNIIILSDDIYNRLVFNDSGLAPHILKQTPSLVNQCLVLNGLSKTYSMTGWRLGWALGPKDIIGAMNRLQSQSVSCASPFTQIAGVQAIEGAQGELKDSLAMLKRRRDFVVQGFSKIDGLGVDVPDGAFYVWTDVSSFLGKKFAGKTLNTSSDFSEALLEDQLVVAVPGIEFGLDGFLRISFALSEDKMSEAIRRIDVFTKKIQ